MPASVSHYVEVGIDEFSDEELVEEIRRRGLAVGYATPIDDDAKPAPVDLKEDAADVMQWLMARRYDRAAGVLENLLAKLIPPQIMVADRAIREGRYSDAICKLDRLIQPSPAVTATSLPRPEQSRGGVQ